MQPVVAREAPTIPAAKLKRRMNNSPFVGRLAAAPQWPPRNIGSVRMKVFALVALVAALAAGPAYSEDGSRAGLPRPDDGYFQTPLKVAPSVWVLAQTRFQVQP